MKPSSDAQLNEVLIGWNPGLECFGLNHCDLPSGGGHVSVTGRRN